MSPASAKLRVGHSINLKAIERDRAIRLSGGQLNLFSPVAPPWAEKKDAPQAAAPTNSPGAEPAEPERHPFGDEGGGISAMS